jgi:hypothetical protein
MAALEKHFTIYELAETWNLSHCTITRLFEDEPGVIKIGKPALLHKRKRFTLRIPESVVIRVHEEIRNRTVTGR